VEGNSTNKGQPHTFLSPGQGFRCFCWFKKPSFSPNTGGVFVTQKKNVCYLLHPKPTLAFSALSFPFPQIFGGGFRHHTIDRICFLKKRFLGTLAFEIRKFLFFLFEVTSLGTKKVPSNPMAIFFSNPNPVCPLATQLSPQSPPYKPDHGGRVLVFHLVLINGNVAVLPPKNNFRIGFRTGQGLCPTKQVEAKTNGFNLGGGGTQGTDVQKTR